MTAWVRAEVRAMVDGHVELEVLDHDPEHLPHLCEMSDDAPGGMGLRIVGRLARSWNVQQQPGGKIVRAVLRRPSKG